MVAFVLVSMLCTFYYLCLIKCLCVVCDAGFFLKKKNFIIVNFLLFLIKFRSMPTYF